MRRLLPLLLALPLTACEGSQSALSPHGDEASRVALLSWILFAGAAAIFALVVGALLLAWRGPERARAALAQERAIRLGGLVFPVVTLTLLLGYGVWQMRDAGAGEQQPELRIDLVGEQWWWRVAYHAPDGRAVADANQIRIPVGREVEIRLSSADVIHSFWVPSLGGKTDMIPGRTNRQRLRAERPGIYAGQCAEYCGGPHALMSFEVVAMPPAEFDTWLAGRAQPREAPATEEQRRGQEAFMAAGCGSCHAIDGTAATGTIGPDLSRFGERRLLAAGALRNGPAEVARFIADTQGPKPGNLMPSFRNLDDAERAAIATYLTGLK
ncbi:hypothetical protein ASE63_12640 [Bosea sp. Root381]|uniref:cytochrome c oxidase subunit II n=1 Tax=Bosea sp. Root381 TaxID=1736524 RepID=UPI0007009A60|nr:cytochrome c oxidase subunit II [Bosea sp. Root381]KRD95856.1 hypothetical protein ASE63_12640 [Bosea sp. Root381]